jgi:hypothetical protein
MTPSHVTCSFLKTTMVARLCASIDLEVWCLSPISKKKICSFIDNAEMLDRILSINHYN